MGYGKVGQYPGHLAARAAVGPEGVLLQAGETFPRSAIACPDPHFCHPSPDPVLYLQCRALPVGTDPGPLSDRDPSFRDRPGPGDRLVQGQCHAAGGTQGVHLCRAAPQKSGPGLFRVRWPGYGPFGRPAEPSARKGKDRHQGGPQEQTIRQPALSLHLIGPNGRGGHPGAGHGIQGIPVRTDPGPLLLRGFPDQRKYLWLQLLQMGPEDPGRGL